LAFHSDEGVQQGDPLGPLLFCLALQSPLSDLHVDFVSGYLDDVGLWDSVENVARDLKSCVSYTRSIGLLLIEQKCEVIGLTPGNRPKWSLTGWLFQSVTQRMLTFWIPQFTPQVLRP
jgi:hypothetical protein